MFNLIIVIAVLILDVIFAILRRRPFVYKKDWGKWYQAPKHLALCAVETIPKAWLKYLPKMQIPCKKIVMDTRTEPNKDARRCA